MTNDSAVLLCKFILVTLQIINIQTFMSWAYHTDDVIIHYRCALLMYAEQLGRKVRELYDAVCRLEEEKYDWEMKLIRQNAEVTH